MGWDDTIWYDIWDDDDDDDDHDDDDDDNDDDDAYNYFSTIMMVVLKTKASITMDPQGVLFGMGDWYQVPRYHFQVFLKRSNMFTWDSGIRNMWLWKRATLDCVFPVVF